MKGKTKALIASSALLGFTTMLEAKHPNIILVLADDLGYGDISAFNPDSKILTPNIDRMCRNGIIFTDAHAVSALSTPSRYSLLTGRYPWRTTIKEGVLGGYSDAMITPERRTIATMLSERGYSTACIGKWHLGWSWSYKPGGNKNNKNVDFSMPVSNGPTDRGFDYFYGIPSSLDISPYVYVENNKATAIPNRSIPSEKGLRLMHGGVAAPDFDEIDCFPNLIRRSIKYINEQKDSEVPYFLYLPITAPHTPVLPTAGFRGRTSVGDYGDFVVMIDDMMKQIIETLKKNNQYENTIIIFTSDNGCAPYVGVKEMEKKGHFPSYIFRGYKTDIYEGGHRIPFVISWGSKYAGSIDHSLVSLSDIYATFAEMLEYKLSDNEAEDSYSLWPVLSGNGVASRPDMVSVSGSGYFSLRNPKLKLVFTGGSGGWSSPKNLSEMSGLPFMQLFDIQKDPSEKKNLINSSKYAEDVKKMTLLMRKYVEDGRSTPGKKVNNDTPNNWPQTKLFMQ